MLTPVDIRHFHLFCGLGGGAKGFNRGKASVGNLQARFRCLGGIDVDPSEVNPLLGRRGRGCELAKPYLLDGVGYCEAAVRELSSPSLFDLEPAEGELEAV